MDALEITVKTNMTAQINLEFKFDNNPYQSAKSLN